MDLSIIIVNWNSADYLRKSLKSIYARTKGLTFEIIVVDNASHDGSESIIMEEFPKARYVQSQENIGFSRANNLGFQHSSGRNLLFLNPDTETMGCAINTMISCLESTPGAGVMGCKLLNSDMSLQTSCIQSFPTITNQVLDIEYLRLMFPGMKLWGIKPLFFNSGRPEEVDVVSGACLMIKREVFEKVRCFSPEYFMYSEELDLCYKVKEAGYMVYYTAEAAIVHHGGKSVENARANYFSILLMKESLLKFLKKTRGAFYGNIFRVVMAAVAVLRLILITGYMPVGLLVFKKRSLYYSYNKWKKIFLWAVFLERGQISIKANK